MQHNSAIIFFETIFCVKLFLGSNTLIKYFAFFIIGKEEKETRESLGEQKAIWLKFDISKKIIKQNLLVNHVHLPEKYKSMKEMMVTKKPNVDLVANLSTKVV